MRELELLKITLSKPRGFDVRSGLSRLFRLRTEIVWVIVGQALAFLGGFAGVKFLTSVMGPEAYGQLALGMTIAGLLNTFLYGPIGQVVSRFFSIYRERGNLAVYLGILRKAHAAAGGFLFMAAAVSALILSSLYGQQWTRLAAIALLFGVVSGINVSFLSLQSAIRQRKIVALHQGADVCLRLALALLALRLLGPTAQRSGDVALLGYFLATTVIVVSQAFFAFRDAEIRDNWGTHAFPAAEVKESWRELVSYAAPFVLWAAFAAVSMYSDRWILQSLFGSRDVGIYTALYQIANAPISLVLGVINQLMLPIIFERAGALSDVAQKNSSDRLLRLTIWISVLVFIPMTVIAYLFSKPLVVTLSSRAFTTSHKMLWIIMLGLCIFNLAQILTTKGLYLNKPIVYLWPKVIQAITFAAGSFMLARAFGTIGVAEALTISSALYLIAVVAANRGIEKSLT